jgi:adenylate cyclase
MLSLPTDDSGRVLVPFRGGSRSYRYVPATDILADSADPALFKDAIVLIGTSAAGLVDLRAVPVQSVFPGVEVHANIVNSILDGEFPHEPDWVEGLNLGVLLALGLLASVLFPRMTASGVLVATVVLAAAYTGAWLWIWDRYAINIAAALPVLMVLGLSSLNMTWGFVTERRARQRLKDMFGQYVPRAVVEQIAESKKNETTFEGETREITVLFADIRGFTPLSERMNANELKRMLNFYLTEMTSIVFDKRGTIDKYVGDMIMAFWGAPLPDADQRSHALDAALTMVERLEALQPELQARGWPEIQAGIGLNTGNMNVGDMGSVYRRCYTVVGDAVNLGSRLEGLSKYYGVRVVASETTRQGQKDYFFRKLDVVRVKGKDKSVVIYEPLCRSSDADARLKSEIDAYHNALDAYFRQDWEKAGRLFESLAKQFPETKLYSLYRDRVTSLAKSDAGIDWDGVFSHSLKWE